MSYVSRAGEKLEAALIAFNLDVTGRICADLGCNVGGFTDCVLRRGAARVYAVDNGYVVTLIKPHYEAPKAWLKGGVLASERLPEVIETVRREMEAAGFLLKGL